MGEEGDWPNRYRVGAERLRTQRAHRARHCLYDSVHPDAPCTCGLLFAERVKTRSPGSEFERILVAYHRDEITLEEAGGMILDELGLSGVWKPDE